jgi:hypothetical protein
MNTRWIGHATLLILAFAISNANAETVLFEDQFDGPVLSSEWTSLLPSQWIDNGWMHSRSSGSTRDSLAIAHDGDATWTDYTLRVRADGLLSMGGQVENVHIAFRCSGVYPAPSAGSWGDHYRVSIFGPQRDVGASIYLWRHRGSAGEILYSRDGIPVTSNPLEVKIGVHGPRIQLWVDGVAIVDIIDPEPLLTGGIGLGAVWESEARFDYVQVTAEIGSDAYRGVASLPDINSAGGSELAAMQVHSDDTASVIIKDSVTKQFVNEITFKSPENVPIGLAGVELGAGNPAVAVLFRAPTGQGVVQLRHAVTGAWINQMRFFGELWEVKSIASQDSDMDGVSEIAVLAELDDGTRAALLIKDADTEQPLNWIELPVE